MGICASRPHWDKYGARICLAVKFLYCPECKELRVKSWYAVRDVCSRCRGQARAIVVPRSALTYFSYALYVLVPGLVGVHLLTDADMYLCLSVAGLVAMMIVSYADISKGEKFARAKIKVTSSDKSELRKKGWT